MSRDMLRNFEKYTNAPVCDIERFGQILPDNIVEISPLGGNALASDQDVSSEKPSGGFGRCSLHIQQ
jgi:hypothetical protein